MTLVRFSHRMKGIEFYRKKARLYINYRRETSEKVEINQKFIICAH